MLHYCPDMLQHYLVSMNKDALAGIIDISNLIRETFSAEELEAHIIFRNECGDSAMVLTRILQPGSIILHLGPSYSIKIFKNLVVDWCQSLQFSRILMIGLRIHIEGSLMERS
jgi:hypothetical protein